MVIIVAIVVLSKLGIVVVLTTGRESVLDKRVTKLPMPIQKAISRPASNPTRAPWEKKKGHPIHIIYNQINSCLELVV